MTTTIVALSTADVTVRSVVVCLLALLALVAVGGRIDWNALRRNTSRPAPIYLRVDQRSTLPYQQPDIRKRAVASGGLVLLALVSGIVIAIAVSIVLATAVGSVTSLLR